MLYSEVAISNLSAKSQEITVAQQEMNKILQLPT